MLTVPIIPVLRRFAAVFADRRGIAAVEFALIAPVLLVLILGGFEAMRGVAASTHATYLSTNLAELLSQQTTTLTQADAQRIIESAPLIDPDILTYAREKGRNDIWNVAKVTLSSIQFAKRVAGCTGVCDYRGDVVFSYAQAGTTRPCGEVNAGTGTTQIPNEAFGPGSVVVVDVKVPYSSLVDVLFGQEMAFHRTSYFRPRYVATVNYQNNCPGF